MKSMKLSQLKTGEKARIVGFAKENIAYRQKLLAMGLTRGTEIELKRIAPLGDPVEITVRGYSLVLRNREADILDIERI